MTSLMLPSEKCCDVYASEPDDISYNNSISDKLYSSKHENETDIIPAGEDLIYDGKCGNDAYGHFNKTTGVMKIRGDGQKGKGDGPIKFGDLNDYITSVEINGITSISGWSFEEMKNLTSVTISYTVTKIEPNAFRNCPNLRYVKLPDSITSLELSLFENCSSLEEIRLPEKIDYIESMTFRNCTSLKKVTIDGQVQRIWDYAFDGCS